MLNKLIKCLSHQSVGLFRNAGIGTGTYLICSALGSYVKLNCDQGFHLPASKYACLTLEL